MLQPYLEKHATTGYYMNTEHADSQQKMAWGEKTEKKTKKTKSFHWKQMKSNTWWTLIPMSNRNKQQSSFL